MEDSHLWNIVMQNPFTSALVLISNLLISGGGGVLGKKLTDSQQDKRIKKLEEQTNEIMGNGKKIDEKLLNLDEKLLNLDVAQKQNTVDDKERNKVISNEIGKLADEVKANQTKIMDYLIDINKRLPALR
jgi:hypothetical protein